MKTEQPILITSILAATIISKNYFIGFDGNICSADAKALGVSNADADQNEQLPVCSSGIALVRSGSAVSKGVPVVSDADGKAVPASNLSVDSDISGVTGSIPADTTAVLSDAAQPEIALSGDIVNSVSGSVLPQAINGYALDAAAEEDELIRVKLV